MAAAHRLRDQRHFLGAGGAGGLVHRPALHLGDAGGNADDNPGTAEEGGTDGLLDEVLEHFGGDVEIGDDAVLQGTHGGDGAGGAADHFLGLAAHGHHHVVFHVHRHHGRLPHDNPLAPHIYQRVGGPQIDPNIAVE